MKTRSILIGAYEMKRPYQKYMALGFGISGFVHLAIVTSAVMLIHPGPSPMIVLENPPLPRTTNFIPNPIPKPNNPEGAYKPKPIFGEYIRVIDEEAPIENDIPTQIDLASMVAATPVTELGGGIIIDTQRVIEAAFPAMDAFTPVDFQPVQVTIVQPHYPDLARRAGIERKVYIMALIDKCGIVKKAVVANPSDSDIGFESAALEAALQSTWKPAVNNGLPVAVWVTYVVDFRLK